MVKLDTSVHLARVFAQRKGLTASGVVEVEMSANEESSLRRKAPEAFVEAKAAAKATVEAAPEAAPETEATVEAEVEAEAKTKAPKKRARKKA